MIAHHLHPANHGADGEKPKHLRPSDSICHELLPIGVAEVAQDGLRVDGVSYGAGAGGEGGRSPDGVEERLKCGLKVG